MPHFESPEHFAERKDGEVISPIVKTAAEKAEEIFSEDAMNPEHFMDIDIDKIPDEWKKEYTHGAIRRDLAKVANLKNRFGNIPKLADTKDQRAVWAGTEGLRCAKALEGILYMHTELSEWLGGSVMVRKTSDYDDFINGADLVAEFNHPQNAERHLALAVDVTFSTGSALRYNRKDKIAKIKTNIEGDSLGDIKYFEGMVDREEYRGPLVNVPRAIIGVERKTLFELSRLWVQGKNKELAEHPVQHIILKELYEQLWCYYKYAEKVGSHNAEQKYKEAFEIIRDVKKSKKAPKGGEWGDDRVLQFIQDQLETNFFYFRT